MSDGVRGQIGALLGWLPGLPELPSVMPRAEVPVYLVHKGRGAEDYFFIFDFEEFVERSQGGMFVRPALKVFAGRDDFDRQRFAGFYRESFAREFEEMRRALATKSERGSWGWLSWAADNAGIAGVVVGSAGLILMSVALFAGRAVLPEIRMPRLFKKTSEAEKLETDIRALQGRVDVALARIDVTLHPELQLQAIRKGGPGDPDQIEHGDWPLPLHVSAHLEDTQSSAWWKDEG